MPTGGEVVSVGSRTSIAADASWTTIRRPELSRSVDGAVTTASIATAWSGRPSATATLTVPPDPLPPLPGDPADPVGSAWSSVTNMPSVAMMSAASRRQIR